MTLTWFEGHDGSPVSCARFYLPERQLCFRPVQTDERRAIVVVTEAHKHALQFIGDHLHAKHAGPDSPAQRSLDMVVETANDLISSAVTELRTGLITRRTLGIALLLEDMLEEAGRDVAAETLVGRLCKDTAQVV